MTAHSRWKPKIGSNGRLAELLGIPSTKLLTLAEQAESLYSPFDRRKCNSAKWRHIDGPKDELKQVQRRITRRLLSKVNLPPGMLGGVRGCSIIDHAHPHVGQPLLVTLDLKDCFPSITEDMVSEALCIALECNKSVAKLLCRLTTLRGKLPQGAPSSMAIANICMIKMHRTLAQAASNLGLTFTQWVDDLSFSGARAAKIIRPAYGIACSHNFSISGLKTRLMHTARAQTMAGLNVNQGISIPPEFRHRIVNAIRRASRRGWVSKEEYNSIIGSVRYIKQIRSTQGDSLARFARRWLPTPSPNAPSPQRGFECLPCIAPSKCRSATPPR